MSRDQIWFSLSCLIIVISVTGCARVETVMPSPTAASSPTLTALSPEYLPTLEPPHRGDLGFTTSDCVLEQRLLPYVCGVIPGQMTMEQVRERLGEPDVSRGGVSFIQIPDKWRIDEIWGYDGIGVYFDDETVVGLQAGLRDYELTLGEVVDVLGPPERIILLHEEGASPPEWEQPRRANCAFFLWPNNGIYFFAGLYGTQGVGLDEDEEVPQFPSELPIGILTAFEPCTLERLESALQEIYRPSSRSIRWIDWPGMNE